MRESIRKFVGERESHLDAEEIETSIGAPHITIGGVEESQRKKAASVDMGNQA